MTVQKTTLNEYITLCLNAIFGLLSQLALRRFLKAWLNTSCTEFTLFSTSDELVESISVTVNSAPCERNWVYVDSALPNRPVHCPFWHWGEQYRPFVITGKTYQIQALTLFQMDLGKQFFDRVRDWESACLCKKLILNFLLTRCQSGKSGPFSSPAFRKLYVAYIEFCCWKVTHFQFNTFSISTHSLSKGLPWKSDFLGTILWQQSENQRSKF